jgi:glycosyltransferase involved in cell wall biosynthesis
VSVIVPAYNAAVYLHYAIDSVLAQTYLDWEIVIVDDGSTDHTRAVVDSYQPQLHDKLQYVHQPKQGVSAARNKGIRAARGEFIALLDADDVWLPHHLERGVQAMDADPAAGLVHARVARIDTRGSVTGQLKVDPKYLSGKSRATSSHAGRTSFARQSCSEKVACRRTAGSTKLCAPRKIATFGSGWRRGTRLRTSTKCWRTTGFRLRPRPQIWTDC